MSSRTPALAVRGLGKAYTITHHRTDHVTLAEVALERLKHPLRRSERERFWALRDVTFGLDHGEVLGLIGRNGAGKSTLLKLLGRITEPSEGAIDLWGRVGSLLEVGTGFHPELTGRENTYLNGSILGMTTKEIDRQFDDIVAFAGVERFLDTPVKRYSSGMYVRLAFAVAAHLETEILLVDEVLAVGDADFQDKCLSKMHEVADEGRTVVFVSHQMRSIERLCTRVIVLADGGVVFDGPPSEGVGVYLTRAAVAAQDVAPAPETRPGTGELRLVDVDAPTVVGAEDPKTVRFRIARHRDGLDRCFVSAVVRDADGVPIAHCDSNLVNQWYVVGNDPVDGEFHLDHPWLHPGDYTVDLFLCNAGILDAYDGAVRFTVRPGYPYPSPPEPASISRDLVPPDFGFSGPARP
jgi:lipopolysaccharide transport system ATP-binding protein